MNRVEDIQEHFAHSTKPLTAELQSPSRRFPERIEASRVMVLGFDNEDITVALRTALNYEDLFKATLSDRNGEQVFKSEHGVLPLSTVVDDATEQEVWSCGRIKAPKGEKSVARLAFEKSRDVKTLATLVTNIREVEDIDKVVSGLEEFKAKYFADPNNPIEELKVEFGGYPHGLIGEVHYKPTPVQEAPAAIVVDEAWSLNSSPESQEATEALIRESQDRPFTVESHEQHEDQITPGPADDDFTPDATGADDFDHEDYAAESPKKEHGVIHFDPQDSVPSDPSEQTVHSEEAESPLSFRNPTPELQALMDDAAARGVAVTIEHPLTESEAAELHGENTEPGQTFAEAIKEAMNKDADIVIGSIQNSTTEYVESTPNNSVTVDDYTSGQAAIFARDEDGELQHIPSLDGVAQAMSDATRERGPVTLDGPLEFQHESAPKTEIPDVTDRAYLMSITEGYEPDNLYVKGSDPANNMSIFPASTETEHENELPGLDNVTSPEGSGGSQNLAWIAQESQKTEVKPSFMSFLDGLGAPETSKAEESVPAPEADDAEAEATTDAHKDIFAWLEEDDDISTDQKAAGH